MAGGGIWKAQNKIRPGAYINFRSKPKPIGTLGDRGIMTCAIPMTWGPSDTLIELYASDLLDGESQHKVGVTAFDGEASLPYRVALSGCDKALIFRTDTDGTKATSTIVAGVTANAKYAGTTGAKIAVNIAVDTPRPSYSTISIDFDGKTKETFVVASAEAKVLEDLESNWVDFVVDELGSAVPTYEKTNLFGGTNGTVETTVYATYLAMLNNKQWQCMAIDTTETTVSTSIIAKIKELREDQGMKVQAVVYNDATANSEGIIAVKQGFKTATETIPVNLFPLWVASHTAGAYINESLTSLVIPGATEIVSPISDKDITEALVEGWFVLSYRQDGKVTVEQDINTYVLHTPDKGYEYSKNRVVRCFDEIGNQVKLIFARSYSGKVDNDKIGRNLYKSELIQLLENLQGISAVTNVDGPSDITVYAGEAIDAVVAELAIQPVDSMEKLYMIVESQG